MVWKRGQRGKSLFNFLFFYNRRIENLENKINEREHYDNKFLKVFDHCNYKIWGRKLENPVVVIFVKEARDYLAMEKDPTILSFMMSSYFLYSDQCKKEGLEPKIAELKYRITRYNPRIFEKQNLKNL